MSCLFLGSARNIFPLFCCWRVGFPFNVSVAQLRGEWWDRNTWWRAGIFQIPFEIHLEIGSSVLRWKARLPATRGRQPGTKQASGTHTTRGLCPQGSLRPTGQPCSLLGASWQYFPEGSSFQSSDHERQLSLTKIGLKAWGRSTKRCYRLENSEAKIYNPMLSSFLALEVMVSFWGNQGDDFGVLLTTICSWIYGEGVFFLWFCFFRIYVPVKSLVYLILRRLFVLYDFYIWDVFFLRLGD